MWKEETLPTVKKGIIIQLSVILWRPRLTRYDLLRVVTQGISRFGGIGLHLFSPSQGETISLGDNDVCEVQDSGTVQIEKFVDGSWKPERIENVLYISKIRKNLFFVGVCTSRSYEVHFKGQLVTISANKKVMAQGQRQENEIYRMLLKVKMPEEANVSTLDLKTWHERLGHINNKSIHEMVNKGIVNNIQLNKKNHFFCEPCQLGKLHRLPFSKGIEGLLSTRRVDPYGRVWAHVGAFAGRSKILCVVQK